MANQNPAPALSLDVATPMVKSSIQLIDIFLMSKDEEARTNAKKAAHTIREKLKEMADGPEKDVLLAQIETALAPLAGDTLQNDEPDVV